MQDRQCTYIVTMRPVRATIVIVENRSITYTEFVFVVLGIQHSMLLRLFVICVLPGTTKVFHINL